MTAETSPPRGNALLSVLHSSLEKSSYHIPGAPRFPLSPQQQSGQLPAQNQTPSQQHIICSAVLGAILLSRNKPWKSAQDKMYVPAKDAGPPCSQTKLAAHQSQTEVVSTPFLPALMVPHLLLLIPQPCPIPSTPPGTHPFPPSTTLTPKYA